MAYEKKFERYMIAELEKMIHNKEHPIFKRENFDLNIIHPDKSYNKKAMEMIEDAMSQHMQEVFEATIGSTGINNVQVPDFEEIHRKRIEDQETIDCEEADLNVV